MKIRSPFIGIVVGGIFFVSVHSSVQAATYTVGGSGANYSTIQACLNVAQPGDTCLVADGTYSGTVTFPRSGTVGNPITLRAKNHRGATLDSGSSVTIDLNGDLNYIVIDGLRLLSTISGRNQSVDLGGNWSESQKNNINAPDVGARYNILRNCYVEGAVNIYGHHNVVESCEFNGNNQVGAAIFESFGPSHHNTYRSNTLYDYTERGVWSLQFTQDTEIVGNTIHDIPFLPIDCDGAGNPVYRCNVRGNTILRSNGHDNGGGTAILMENAFNSVVEGNLIDDVTSGIAAINYGNGSVFHTDGNVEYRTTNLNMIIRNNIVKNYENSAIGGAAAPGVKALNNVMYSGATVRQGAISLDHVDHFWSNNWEIKNNIISGYQYYGLWLNGPSSSANQGLTGLSINNNLYYTPNKTISHFGYNGSIENTLDGFRTATGLEQNSLWVDPRFISPGSDFHLQANSPAINTGATVSAPIDREGVTRPVGSAYDLGVFEFGGTPTSPPPSPSPTPTPPSSPNPTACRIADITEDGVVNLADFTVLASNFMSTNPANTRTDINGDGAVNLADFTLLAGQFMESCE